MNSADVCRDAVTSESLPFRLLVGITQVALLPLWLLAIAAWFLLVLLAATLTVPLSLARVAFGWLWHGRSWFGMSSNTTSRAVSSPSAVEVAQPR